MKEDMNLPHERHDMKRFVTMQKNKARHEMGARFVALSVCSGAFKRNCVAKIGLKIAGRL